jgi:hypothetical protein
MSTYPGRIPIIGLASFLTLACTSFSQGAYSFTKQDILNILLDQDARISDFYIDFDLEETHTDANNAVILHKHENITYIAKDNLFRTRKKRFDPEKDNEVAGDWEFSADGQRKFSCDRLAFDGSVEASLPENAAIKQGWAVYYLISIGRMPRRKGNRGYECNLIGTLEEDETIELSQELLDGRQTVVLVRPGFEKIYLDPKMNFAVVAGCATGKLTFKFKNSEFVQVAKGIWMPMKTERTFKGRKNFITRKIQVKQLKVNNDFTEKDFRIAFEPGIRVWDANLKTYVSPSSSELDSIYLDQLVDTARQRNFIDVYHVADSPNNPSAADDNAPQLLSPNAQLHTVADADASNTLPWRQIVTFVSLGLTVLLLIAFWQIRRRAKP